MSLLLSKQLGALLAQKNLTVSVAESCTGGMVGAAITDVAGSSRYFAGGVIAYSNEVKVRLLGVPEEVIEKYGAVSSETVLAMASGTKRLFQTDTAISVSGIAGPVGGSAEKPVGLVYIGIAAGENISSFHYRFDGTRAQIRSKSVEEGLRRLIEHI